MSSNKLAVYLSVSLFVSLGAASLGSGCAQGYPVALEDGPSGVGYAAAAGAAGKGTGGDVGYAGTGGSSQAGSGGTAQAGSAGSAQAGSGGGSQAGAGGSAQAGSGGSSQAGSGGSAQAGSGGATSHFMLGDASNYAHKPSAMAALLNVQILDEHDLWDISESPFDPPQKGIQAAATSVMSSNPAFVMLTIGQWQHDLYSTSTQQLSAAISNYATTVQRVQAALPNYPVGYYAIVPFANYSAPLKGASSNECQTWKAHNTSCAPIAQAAGILYPLLFTFEDDISHWQTVAALTIQEAHRIGPSKPIVPVLRPRFHEGNKKWQPLPASMWRQELEYLYANADGAIVWDDRSAEDVTAATPWWTETAAMLAAHPEINH